MHEEKINELDIDGTVQILKACLDVKVYAVMHNSKLLVTSTLKHFLIL
jgi:hypothetical protein